MLQACSSGGSNNNNNNSNSIVLCKKMSWASGSFDYTYDGNRILMATSGGEVVLKYYYTGDLITKVEDYDSNELARRLTFSYNNINQLDSEEVVYYLPDPSNPTYTKTDYTYNSNNTISFIEYTGVPGSYSVFTNGTITLVNNEENVYQDNFQTITMTYDNKNSPFKNVLGVDKLFPTSQIGFGGRYSNPITVNFSNNSTNTYQYQYNEQDYPISCVSGQSSYHYFY
jgi:hypothetical protein